MIALPLPDHRPIVLAITSIEIEHMADDPPIELLLTYAELGDRLGIGADGARFKARRAGWPVTQGNDGRARVRVRANELPDQPPEQPQRSGDRRTIDPDLLADLRRAHADRLADQIARAEAAEHEAELWRSKAEQARSEAERHRAVAELLCDQVRREIERSEALAGELRELRRPWLLRALAAWKR